MESLSEVQEFVIRTDRKSLVHLTGQRLHTEWQQKALTKMMGLSYRIEYKKGINNAAADSLSRRPHGPDELLALSSTQPMWLDDILSSYTQDPKARLVLILNLTSSCRTG